MRKPIAKSFVLGASLAVLAIASGAYAKPHKATKSQADLQADILAETRKMLDAQKAEFDQAEAAKQAQIDALQSKVSDLTAQLQATKTQVAAIPPAPTVAQLAPQVAAALPKPDTTVAMKKGTASVASSDGAFTVAIHGVMQLDAASYDQDKALPAAVTARDLNSGTNFRRARLGINGKLFSDFDYNILAEFGGSGAEDAGRLQEMWLQYSKFDHAKIRIGAYPPLVGLEDAASTNSQPFMERPASAEVARSLSAGDYRMSAGVFGYGDRWLYSLALTGNTISTLNTQATGFTAANTDEQLGVAARLAGTPLRGFDWLVHVGVNYTGVINPADAGASAATRYPVQLRDRPELRVDGTRLIDTGALNAQSASATGFELAGQYKSLFAQGEAFTYKVERYNAATGVTNPTFKGWYVEGGWSLTGEARKYNTQTAAFDGVVPRVNFDPKAGKWGAFELVARYSTLDLNYHEGATLAADRVLGGQQDISSLGLDWQLNTDVRFVFEGQSVKIDRLNSAGAQIGQTYSAYAVRSQFNF
ncbi:porin [Asticcacaulis solisilvae]|uniref:porin n=1 Tax=Asticcacaulis solisilvae TaxID=1217274 RepID=UPI003FD845ED